MPSRPRKSSFDKTFKKAMTAAQPRLWKTEIVIWSRFDPQQRELSALAQEAESGEAYASSVRFKNVQNPAKDPDWDGTDFFAQGSAFSTKE